MRLRLKGIAETMGMLNRAGNIAGKVEALKREFAFGVHANIKRGTPTSSGKRQGGFLRSSNVVDVRGVEIVWANVADYARYVDLGTGQRGGASWEQQLPEEEPVAFALHWPGMKGQPFMRMPIAEGLKELDGKIKKLAKEIG